jgi:hypothetical protein
MRYGNGISKLKKRWAVPDNRILPFAVLLMATQMLIASTEPPPGKKFAFPRQQIQRTGH